MNRLTIIIYTLNKNYSLGYHNLEGCRKPKFEFKIFNMTIRIFWGKL